MDCHDPNTEWSLLGFFKEPNYHEWMEQLFKHEGDCVWTDEEYKFMQKNREQWPSSCTITNTTVNGKYLYYDIKPEPFGSMGIGLYTDSKCIEEYKSKRKPITAEEVLINMYGIYGGGGDQGSLVRLGKQLQTWNNAFDVFKYCNPCKAYDLVDIVAGSNYQRNVTGSRYVDVGHNDGGGGGDNGFVCYDAADYTDVNQCMKFKTKTKMMTATVGDVTMAHMQGSITSFNVGEQQYAASQKRKTVEFNHWWGFLLSYVWLILSTVLIGHAAATYYDARKQTRESDATQKKVPLLAEMASRRQDHRDEYIKDGTVLFPPHQPTKTARTEESALKPRTKRMTLRDRLNAVKQYRQSKSIQSTGVLS